MIWTGDSVRHDNDEKIPRDEKEVKQLNEYCVGKFREVFSVDGKMQIPIVPTWGNNDVLPHNIFHRGPNKWTRLFLDVWRDFIPESQRHAFEYGGWFWSEVIPNKLAVLSVNSLYFADNNAAVEGCADKSQPGYAQFEWLRVQLELLRERGMKAIIMGHQAPARTESKRSWDESCWQKYTLWLYQYRDIIVGTAWGHMNIDHFMLQDVKDVTIGLLNREIPRERAKLDEEFTVSSVTDYLTELRQLWHRLPSVPKQLGSTNETDATEKKKTDKYYKEIGGPYGQRYSLSLVSPSVVPNYYPTLRVVEYNISNLNSTTTPSGGKGTDLPSHLDPVLLSKKFKIPKSPSKSAPPGPAYSPQPLTWLKYTQYYSNLTIYNENIDSIARKDAKNKDGDSKPHLRKLGYEIEYDTSDGDVYNMTDLTVLSYLKLAETIGKYKPIQGSDLEPEKHRKDHKKDKKNKKKNELVNKVWHTFIRRVFVGAMEEDELEDHFGSPV